MPAKKLIPLFVLLSLLAAACGQAGPTTAPTPAAPTAAPTETTAPTPTPEPRSLTICLGYEPATLYPLASTSPAMWSVLEAIYDGPVDLINYAPTPVILEELPTLANGGVTVGAVDVSAGDEVVNTAGELVVLEAGTQVYPSGCSSQDCAVVYDGASSLQMDSLTAVFRLLPGLQWSDGQPLVADDSVFTYELTRDPQTPASKYDTDRTASYRALDESTVEWVGRPGWMDPLVSGRFWQPLPRHAWGTLTAADLLNPESPAAAAPLGWGPYVFSEWVRGDHITLTKNPNYFRAAEGLPAFDLVVYRFLSDNPRANMRSFDSGECDILDTTTFLESELVDLHTGVQGGFLQLALVNGPAWEHLDFGIRPASYDDGYNPASGDRPDIFGDVRTRQAFAMCLDRAGLNQRQFFDKAQVPLSYLPNDHPLAGSGLPEWGYDPQAGAALLDEVGWKDSDGDPATPRVAQGVSNVPDGTPLVVSWMTTQAELRKTTSEQLAGSLSGCGVGINLQYFNPGDLFAAGPGGPVFARNFDLVQFTWESSALPLCSMYRSDRAPAEANRWIGTNVSGYASPEFDAACAQALAAPPGSPEAAAAGQRAQEIFATDLPLIPLYTHLSAATARTDLCGIQPASGTRSLLWNIELLDYGPGCPEQ